MKIAQIPKRFETHAPGFLGALFISLLVLGAPSCKKGGTPDWDTPGETPPASRLEETTAPPAPQPPAPAAPPAAEAASSEGLRFIAYNVENWLAMDRYVDRQSLKNAPKPESEKAAAIRILVRHSPDVVGLCEIGTLEDLAEIQARLKENGLDLPHSRYVGGSDPVRHLGLLSRFPIAATASPAETEYQLDGKTFAVNRGILDATIDARGKSYRFVGVHLKSKREVREGDQEAMRRNEARLLRRHVDSIFAADPAVRLAVYGDFNDTRGNASFKTATGRYNDPAYLSPLFLKDSTGVSWTHFWSAQDVYSRIDFVTVSKSLHESVNMEKSRVLDDPEWSDASDHRPILVTFD